MKLTTKHILIIISVILILLIAVSFWFYYKGKKQVTIQTPPNDNPDGNGQNNNPYAVSDSQITQIADSLYRDMDGFNYAGHDVLPYQNLEALSDTDFVRVYNQFNYLHQADSEETLKQWIESESYAFNDVVESILTRMGRLNLI